MGRPASTLAIAAALGTVYLVWGSTYLAIRWAIDTMPPLLMGGMRWIIAGSILYAVARWRSGERPTWENWKATGVVGLLLIVGGNGSVNVAEQWVPSGLTALLIATVPLWMVLVAWMRGGARPNAAIGLGVAVGLLGVVLLAGPGGLSTPTDPRGLALLVFATISWAYGSIWSRTAALPRSLLLGSAMEMLVGGVVMTGLGLALGEQPAQLLDVTPRSVGAFLFLVAIGSIVTFSAYVWLLQVAPPATVGTYAFVNPLVAVLLGWLLNDEVVGAGTLVAGGLILAAVAILLWQRAREGRAQAVAARAPVARAR